MSTRQHRFIGVLDLVSDFEGEIEMGSSFAMWVSNFLCVDLSHKKLKREIIQQITNMMCLAIIIY